MAAVSGATFPGKNSTFLSFCPPLSAYGFETNMRAYARQGAPSVTGPAPTSCGTRREKTLFLATSSRLIFFIGWSLNTE